MNLLKNSNVSTRFHQNFEYFICLYQSIFLPVKIEFNWRGVMKNLIKTNPLFFRTVILM